MKIIITERQYNILLEQPDSKMPGQIEKFGYKQNNPKTLAPALKLQEDFLNSINFENFDEFMEAYREALYSPEAIAISTFFTASGIGAPAVITAWGALLAYDIYKWIDSGEPDYLNLFFDVLGVASSGVLSGVIATFLKSLKGAGNLTPIVSNVIKSSSWGKISPYISKLKTGLDWFLSKITEGINWLSKYTGITFLKNLSSRIITKIKEFVKTILDAIENATKKSFNLTGTSTKISSAGGQAAREYTKQNIYQRVPNAAGGLIQP
jgi:hypothetical protein